MKKIVSLLLALVLSFAAICSVSAAGITAEEQKIVDALDQEVTLANGYIATLPDDYINQVEDFLTRVDLTQEEIDEIMGYINASVEIVKRSNATSAKTFENNLKDEIIVYAKKAAEVIHATLTISIGYHATLKFDENAKGGYANTTVFSKTTAIIKQTGVQGDVVMTVVASVLLVAAASFVFVSSRKKVSEN